MLPKDEGVFHPAQTVRGFELVSDVQIYLDLLQTVTTPDPDGNGPATTQTTTSYYNAMLQVTNVLQPDGTSVFTSYHPNGLRQRTWGSRVYPVAYTYDHAGRMQTMTTWQEFNQATGQGVSGAATTSWHYDAQRGWLTNKAYADGLGTTYSNTPAGRLARRDWARGVSTTYGYGDAGDLATVAYSDATPAASYGYDGQGHQTTNTQGDTTVTRLFDNVGNLLSEGYTGGPLAGLTVTNTYDAALRRTNLTLLNAAAAVLLSQSYRYDSAARLAQVTAGGASATYGYLANSPLVEHLWFTNNGALRMTTTKQYDYLNRLTRMASAPISSPEVSFAYAYNAANQRTALTNTDNAYWVYSYDALGQVTSGKKYWADGTLVAGQQFEYTFDDIGNRTTARAGGDAFGANLRPAEYYPNSLNQYGSNTVPGWVPVLGQANSNATVTLWADNGAYAQTDRKGDYYRGELAATNHSGAVWLTLTNLAVLRQGTNTDIVSSATGRVLVAQSPQAFTHDFDGNLTSDGLWTNTWNAENRRVSVESRTDVPPAARAREDWTHLPDGRWIERIVSTWDESTQSYQASATNRFVWDSQVLLAVLDHTNGVVLSFTRGLDLSGTVNGAGGAGGLLWLSVGSPPGVASSHAAAYDGNGNVMALVNLADGTESARYEYGPFGEPLRQSGPMAETNPLRFSTQYADELSGEVKYLFRDYREKTGRWHARDPIGEEGGINLYSFVDNSAIEFVDFNGLTTVKKHAWSISQQQAMSGIWGWTDLESQTETPAKLKFQKKCGMCAVTKKPEMVFTISVQTARSGKQSWKETAFFDGVTYPDTSVYVGSGLAKFSGKHEEKRFQAWKKALTSFWPAHYEDPAAELTAPTCDELKAKIDALRQQAATEWETSAEGMELVRRLFEIGQEGAPVKRWTRKSGFGSVRIIYNTN